MFLKYILVLAVFITSIVCVETAKPSTFVTECKKRLEVLIERKKAKSQIILDSNFDVIANDTDTLLKELDKQSPQEPVKNQDTIKMINHNLQILENLLKNKNKPEPVALEKSYSPDLNGECSSFRPTKKVKPRKTKAELEKEREKEREEQHTIDRNKRMQTEELAGW